MRRYTIGIHPLIAFAFFFLLIYVMTDKLLAALVVGAVATMLSWGLTELMDR